MIDVRKLDMVVYMVYIVLFNSFFFEGRGGGGGGGCKWLCIENK